MSCTCRAHRPMGFAQLKQIKNEITLEVGGWVQVSLGKKLENCPKNSPLLVPIFWGGILCVFCVYTLLVIMI